MERWVHVYSEHNTLCYDKSIMWWYNNVEKKQLHNNVQRSLRNSTRTPKCKVKTVR